MKIAIIGSGIAGNVVAHHLHRAHDITVFESAAHIGGHTVAPVQLVPLLVLALAYSRRSLRLARQGRGVPIWRQGCFAGGLVVILIALVSPLNQVNEELFLAHMTQHLLLGDIAALLLVSGLTGPLLAPILRLRVARWLQFLAHPLVALPLWLLNLYIWHLPFLYQATLTSELVHAAQHACFLSFGMLVWMPLFGPLPMPEWFGYPSKFVYLLAFRFSGGVLGNVLIWTGSEIYPDYGETSVAFGIGGVQDQSIGGSIMMMESIVLTVALMAWLGIEFAKRDEAAQQLVDEAYAHGVDLDLGKAKRAVAAGTAEELRRRLRDRGPSAAVSR